MRAGRFAHWDSDYFVALTQYCAGAVELNATNRRAAITALERALLLSRTCEIGLLLPAASSALGLSYVHCGRTDEGIPLLEQAVSQLRLARVTTWIATYEYKLAEGYFLAGRQTEATAVLARAMTAAKARGERTIVGWALWLEGELALSSGNLRRARRKLAQALALAQSLGLRPLEATCRVSIARCLRLRNDRLGMELEIAASLQLLHSMDMSGRLSAAMRLLELDSSAAAS